MPCYTDPTPACHCLFFAEAAARHNMQAPCGRRSSARDAEGRGEVSSNATAGGVPSSKVRHLLVFSGCSNTLVCVLHCRSELCVYELACCERMDRSKNVSAALKAHSA